MGGFKEFFGLAGAASLAASSPVEKAPEKPSFEEVSLDEKAGLRKVEEGTIGVPEPDMMPGSEASEAAIPDREPLYRAGYTDNQIDATISGNPLSIGEEPDSMSKEELEKLDKAQL